MEEIRCKSCGNTDISLNEEGLCLQCQVLELELIERQVRVNSLCRKCGLYGFKNLDENYLCESCAKGEKSKLLTALDALKSL